MGNGSLVLQRLKTRAQFQAVLNGETWSRTQHFTLHGVALGGVLTTPITDPLADVGPPLFALSDVWLGAMVPKRWAKRAVTRNAIKRQIYAVSLEFESSMACAAHVVRLRSAFDRKLFFSATSDALKAAVRHELQQLFARANSWPPARPQVSA